MNFKKVNFKKLSIFIALNYIIYLLFGFFKIVLLPLIMVMMFKEEDTFLSLIGNSTLIIYLYINITSIIFLVLGTILLFVSFIKKNSLFYISIACIGLFIIRFIIFNL